MVKQYFIIAISSVFLACAGSSEPSEERDPGAVSARSDCISTRTIRDYRVLDEANLVVTANASRKYHISLSRRAVGLRASSKIGFRSTGGRVCAGFDDIIVDDGFGPERIRITGVRELTPEQYDELLVAFGKKQPAIKPAPATRPVESAEVEELD